MAKKGKLTGKKKASFLRRMAAGRRKAANKVKKTIGKRRKSSNKKRKAQSTNTKPKRKNTVAKKKSKSRARSVIDKITKNKFVRGTALGLGGAALAVQVTERVAPQFSPIAQHIGAFVLGGPIGLIANALLSGGLSSIFGGSGGQAQSTMRTSL